MKLRSAKILCIAATLFLAGPLMAVGSSDNGSMDNASEKQPVSLKTGEPFLRARSRIIKLGWKPTQMHQNDHYEYSSIEKELAKRKVVEIDACSVDAGVLCIFYYSKMGKCLRVNTIGETIAQITVNGWTEECPDKNQ